MQEEATWSRNSSLPHPPPIRSASYEAQNPAEQVAPPPGCRAPKRPKLDALLLGTTDRDEIKSRVGRHRSKAVGISTCSTLYLIFNPPSLVQLKLHDLPYEFPSATDQVAETELKGAFELRGAVSEDENNEAGPAMALL